MSRWEMGIQTNDEPEMTGPDPLLEMAAKARAVCRKPRGHDDIERLRLREALEAVEWVEAECGPGQVDGMCPWCQSWYPKHAIDCERQLALASLLRPDVETERTR